MPTVTLPFGPSHVDVELPEGAHVVPAAGAPRGDATIDPGEAARAALARPLGMPRIGELVRPGSRVLVAFDDPTVGARAPVREPVIRAVIDELRAAGVADGDVRFICANALHRKWTREELGATISPALAAEMGDRLTCHDAEDATNLVYFGATSSGYDVEVHRALVEADLAVYVNNGYHLGFNGGWKSVCVGLSTWRSIRWTHNPDGMSMSVHENRMHRVYDEMGEHLERRMAKRVFKVETLNAGANRALGVWAGGVGETRAAAVEHIAAASQPRRSAVAEKADIVVYGVPDWSPYATFARMNPILYLISSGLGYLGGYIEALGKPGCSVVLATPCPDDWDMEHHPSYREVWDRVLPELRDPYEISRRYEDEFVHSPAYIERYRFGVAFHPVHAILATHPLKRLKHAARVYVAGALDPAVPAHLGFIATPTVEAAVAEARKLHGPDATVVCIDHSALARAQVG